MDTPSETKNLQEANQRLQQEGEHLRWLLKLNARYIMEHRNHEYLVRFAVCINRISYTPKRLKLFGDFWRRYGSTTAVYMAFPSPHLIFDALHYHCDAKRW